MKRPCVSARSRLSSHLGLMGSGAALERFLTTDGVDSYFSSSASQLLEKAKRRLVNKGRRIGRDLENLTRAYLVGEYGHEAV